MQKIQKAYSCWCCVVALLLPCSLLASCWESLADGVSLEFAKQAYFQAEHSFIRNRTLDKNRRKILNFLPSVNYSIRDQITFMSEHLPYALDNGLSFNSNFSSVSLRMENFLEGEADSSLMTLPLVIDPAFFQESFFTELRSIHVAATLANANFTSVLLAAQGGMAYGRPYTPVVLKTFKHADTFEEDNLASANLERSLISRNGFMLNQAEGLVLGLNKGNGLAIFRLDMGSELDAPKVFVADVRLPSGEKLYFDLKKPYSIDPRDVLYDSNSGTFALRVGLVDGAFDQVTKKDRYYFLEKNEEGDSFVLQEDYFVETHEPLPQSFAYLPYASQAAYRNAQGDFIIQDLISEKKLFEQKQDAFSESHYAFPKVLSFPDFDGGSFVVLHQNGLVQVWNSASKKMRDLKLLSLFNQDSLVDGLSISANSYLTLVWGQNGVKVLATHESIGLQDFKLPLAARGKIKNALFSPDNSGVFVFFSDGSATLVEVKSGLVLANFTDEQALQLLHALEPFNLNYRYDE